jgi:hypothetical protein
MGTVLMTAEETLRRLQTCVGRPCVFIEDGTFCIARVAEVAASDVGMQALLDCIPDLSLSCLYRHRPPQFREGVYPFGSRWEIGKEWKWFYLNEDHWDGSPYMGFHVLFAREVVERFLARDLCWIDDYF